MIPIPAFKRDENGDLVFCSRCAIMWGIIALGVLLLVVAMRRKV